MHKRDPRTGPAVMAFESEVMAEESGEPWGVGDTHRWCWTPLPPSRQPSTGILARAWRSLIALLTYKITLTPSSSTIRSSRSNGPPTQRVVQRWQAILVEESIPPPEERPAPLAHRNLVRRPRTKMDGQK
jgi:hypothetical protein